MTQGYIFLSNDLSKKSLSRAFAMIAFLKTSKKAFTLCCIALLFALLPNMGLMAQTTIDLSVSNASITGTGWSCDASGNSYTITGNVTVIGTVSVSSGLTFAINPATTVTWNANVTASIAAPLVSVSGSGTLAVYGTISNTGNGDALDVNGAGSTITIGSTGVVSSNTKGNPIMISVNNVTITVGGLVESMANNGNAAILIQNELTGSVINVNGGSVVSVNSGYAISDGAVFTTVAGNNTSITISNGGAVTAGTACAIRSAGGGSTVVVSGGVVSNAAGNNANPAIYMNGGTGLNVTVSGGTVQ